jgi:Calcineurin-like phosphoesterase
VLASPAARYAIARRWARSRDKPGAVLNGRTIVVGDVHGCADELDALLDKVAFCTGDTLVFVGDLIARGPKSLGVLDIARRTGAIIVRGNHEDHVLRWRTALQRERTRRTVTATLSPFHREIAAAMRPVDWSLLRTSPLHVDLAKHGVRVVHAGVVPGIAFADQSPRTLMRIRTIRPLGPRGAIGRDVLWGSLYAGPPHVIFGHNAAPGLQMHPWATGIDTGCVYGGQLTALVLQREQTMPRGVVARRRLLTAVPARRVYHAINQ